MTKTAIIVTHPYPSFDKNTTGMHLCEVLEQFQGEKIMIKAKDAGKPYCPELYNDILEEDKESALQVAGPGAIKAKDAEKIVKNFDHILIAGGYMRECLSNTMNSIIRTCEELQVKRDVKLVKNLIYVQAGKSHKIYSLSDALDIVGDHKKREFFERIKDSKFVNGGLTEL